MVHGITRRRSETWRDAAIRIAKPRGLEEAVVEAFERHVASGCDRGLAAFHACMDLDVFEDLPDQPD